MEVPNAMKKIVENIMRISAPMSSISLLAKHSTFSYRAQSIFTNTFDAYAPFVSPQPSCSTSVGLPSLYLSPCLMGLDNRRLH